MKGKWTGVGGKTMFFEEPVESCIREVKEETGLKIEPKLAGIITTINKAIGSKWFLFVYVANGYHGELKQSHEGILEWVGEEKLYEKDLAFIKVSLPYILHKERKGIITGKIIHNGREVLGCILRDEGKILLKIPMKRNNFT
jgi:8-oxo-dGTP diphosphatase